MTDSLVAFPLTDEQAAVPRLAEEFDLLRRLLAQADIGGARAVGMRAAHYLPDGRPGGVASGAVVRQPAVLARLG